MVFVSMATPALATAYGWTGNAGDALSPSAEPLLTNEPPPWRSLTGATAAPMPVPPPVTMATLSARRIDVSSSGSNDRGYRRAPGVERRRLVDGQAGHDGLVDRGGDAVLQAPPDDGAAQRVHLEAAAILEVARHRRSPLRGQRGRLPDDR